MLMTHESVHGSVDLVLDVTALLLAELDGVVDQTLVGGLVRGLEDERRVRRGILRLVLVDGWGVCVSYDGSGARRFIHDEGERRGKHSLAKSPESHTTTVPEFLSWSRELDMVAVIGEIVKVSWEVG